uniref:transcriptional repressor LexA n=1 Tax=Vaginimicrobium propionicum TaxID=1871034 RepID=UPI00097122E3|nr:transcriptional repressor LexA [Vaginimicrobium propionicum]
MTKTPKRPESTGRVGRPSGKALAKALGKDSAETSGSDADGLTARQRLLLEVISESIEANGYPPSIREMGRAAGLASPSSVAHQLNVLEKLGYIRRQPNRSRALEVHLPPSMRESIKDDINSVSVPLIGRIAAGAPIFAQQHEEDVFDLPQQLVGHGEVFMLEVRGDSMIEAAICDGDYVVVRRQPQAENGEIVAAMIDGEATVKTFKKTADQIWLLPHNPNYQPINGNNATILGKVVTVLRRL